MSDVYDGLVKFYWPNGNLQFEAEFANGIPVGFNRRWHENGQLEVDANFVNGREHGITKQWAPNGTLLGSYEMDHGTGVSRKWRDNGHLDCEFTELKGQYHGRARGWSLAGELESETYYIRGNKVSKKKYFEACLIDSTLPRYGDTDGKTLTPAEQSIANSVRRWIARQSEIKKLPKQQVKEPFADYVSEPTTCEARRWLSNNQGYEPLLGKIVGQQAARDLINDGYTAGCKTIYVVNIKRSDSDHMEHSDSLVVELPASKAKRTKALHWLAAITIEHSGNEPDDDHGQTFWYIFLD